jgi:hypothetical protein
MLCIVISGESWMHCFMPTRKYKRKKFQTKKSARKVYFCSGISWQFEEVPMAANHLCTLATFFTMRWMLNNLSYSKYTINK